MIYQSLYLFVKQYRCLKMMHDNGVSAKQKTQQQRKQERELKKIPTNS